VEGPKSASVCLSTAFVTLEQGRMAAVEWVDNSADRVHTRVVEMESHVVDANIDLRPDATASHAAVTVSVAGDKDVMPMARGLGAGDLLVAAHSELDRAAVRRARALGRASVTIPGASLYESSRADIAVERTSPTDWILVRGSID
jgi:hypothetical protein